MDTHETQFVTKSGKILSNEEIAALSEEAEDGYRVFSPYICCRRSLKDALAGLEESWEAFCEMHGQLASGLYLGEARVMCTQHRLNQHPRI